MMGNGTIDIDFALQLHKALFEQPKKSASLPATSESIREPFPKPETTMSEDAANSIPTLAREESTEQEPESASPLEPQEPVAAEQEAGIPSENAEETAAASPQLEDGFTKIANEILEALMRADISGHGWRLLMAVFRKTYGWNKKTDWISNSQFVNMTGLRKQRVNDAIKELIDKKIVSKSGVRVGFQKDHAQWRYKPRDPGNGKPLLPKDKSNGKPLPVTEEGYSNGKPFSSNGKPCTQKKLLQKKKDKDYVSPETGLTSPAKNPKTLKPPTRVKPDNDEIPYQAIIDDLNQRTGKHFKLTKKHGSLIRARWDEGYRLNDFLKVHENKVSEWLNDSKFRRYLQPSTLYAPSHFDEYLNSSCDRTEEEIQRERRRLLNGASGN